MTLPIAPNQTLYIKNLDDKISSRELKIQLYCLFSLVAPVVNIEARKSIKTRGQAWVSFISEEAATIAMQRLQGFNFLGKEMHIEYSKSQSKALHEIESIKKIEEPETESEDEEPVIKETPILKVEGYPPKANEKVLSIIFKRIPGFQSVEMKDGYAIVIYDAVESASKALNSFQNFKVRDYRLSVQFHNTASQEQ